MSITNELLAHMSYTAAVQKNNLREQLDTELAEFLAKGGEIKHIPTGQSGESGALFNNRPTNRKTLRNLCVQSCLQPWPVQKLDVKHQAPLHARKHLMVARSVLTVRHASLAVERFAIPALIAVFHATRRQQSGTIKNGWREQHELNRKIRAREV